MLAKDINKILKDKNMQNRDTNLKILKKKTSGGPGNPRKPPKWFIDFKRENDARWVEQEEFNRQISKSFSDFANQMLEFVKEQKEFNRKQEQFNSFVLNMFKKHKWM